MLEVAESIRDQQMIMDNCRILENEVYVRSPFLEWLIRIPSRNLWKICKQVFADDSR